MHLSLNKFGYMKKKVKNKRQKVIIKCLIADKLGRKVGIIASKVKTLKSDHSNVHPYPLNFSSNWVTTYADIFVLHNLNTPTT